MAVAQLTPVTPASPPLPGMTADEFLEFCGDEKFLELVRGEVVPVTLAGIEHNLIESEVYDRLKEFVKQGKIGFVLTGDAGFILERNPSTVRSPDVAFVSRERFDQVDDIKGFFPGAPDLAVEVLSPTDPLPATEAKARMYLRAGCLVVWILNPADHTLRIYRADAEPQILGPDGEADAEPALPGFRCPVRDLFQVSEK
jgi:Uma2 family endonuclease